MGLSLPHILLFALIAVLVLGGGRFSAMMGDVAKGVKQFKKGMAEEDADGRPIVPPAHVQPTMIGGRSAADIIAEHEAKKAADAAAAAAAAARDVVR